MLMISTVPEAIGLMVVGIFLLGTWPAVWNLIEQRGKLPSHIFLDYALTYLAFITLAAMTLGQLGPPTPAAAAAAAAAHGQGPYMSMNFFDQLRQPNGQLVAFAIAGGFCCAIGDLAIQYATAMLGLSIGPPVLNSLTVIIGVIVAYFLDGGINKPQLVFPGMAFAALAIALGSAAHLVGHAAKSKNEQQQQRAVRLPAAAAAAPAAAAAMQDDSARACNSTLSSNSSSQCKSIDDCIVDVEQQQQSATAAVAAGVKLERQRSIHITGRSRFFGLGIAVAGGIIYSLFLPAFQIAATDPFKLLPAEVPPLSVYTAAFYFSAGFTALSVIINVIFLYRPPLGTAASSITRYITDNDGRWLAMLSGVLAGAGDFTQFMGGQTAGYAACMLVMAYPVVGVVWGFVRFKEYKQGTWLSRLLVVGQVACYGVAVGLLASSAELRHH